MRVVRRSLAEALEHWGPGSREYGHVIDHLTLLQIEEGLVDAALAAMQRPDAVCDTDEDVCVHTLLAHSVAGHRDEVAAAFERLLQQAQLHDSSRARFAMLEVGLALLHVGIPVDDVRDRYFPRLATHPAGEFILRHLEGPVLLAAGDPAGAVAALTAVLTMPDPALYRPTVGSLRTLQARALLATGDRAAAVTVAREALADLSLWPGWRRERADALLRRLEGSTRTDGELTSREREVAALIAEGLTNGQIAERLFISPKTAAVHVSNILTKLGLSSRVEIAAWAVRHGMALQPS